MTICRSACGRTLRSQGRSHRCRHRHSNNNLSIIRLFFIVSRHDNSPTSEPQNNDENFPSSSLFRATQSKTAEHTTPGAPSARRRCCDRSGARACHRVRLIAQALHLLLVRGNQKWPRRWARVNSFRSIISSSRSLVTRRRKTFLAGKLFTR